MAQGRRFSADVEEGLELYDELEGIDWEWLALDGAMTKAPFWEKRNRA